MKTIIAVYKNFTNYYSDEYGRSFIDNKLAGYYSTMANALLAINTILIPDVINEYKNDLDDASPEDVWRFCNLAKKNQVELSYTDVYNEITIRKEITQLFVPNEVQIDIGVETPNESNPGYCYYREHNMCGCM